MNDHEGVVDSRNVYHLNKANIENSGVKLKNFFFKNKKNLFIFLMMVSMILLTAAVITLLVLYAKFQRPIDLCDSTNCMLIASSLKETMDTSVNPCDDFYKYTCGKWSEAHPTMEVNQTYSWSRERMKKNLLNIKDLLAQNFTNHKSVAVQKVKTFFDSCMNQEARNNLGLHELYNLLEELRLPKIPASITKKTKNFLNPLVTMRRMLGTDIFFGVDVTEHPDNSSLRVIMFSHWININYLPISKFKKIGNFLNNEFFDMVKESCENEDLKEKKDSREKKKIMFDVFKYIIINTTVSANNITYDPCEPKSLNISDLVSDTDIQETVDQLWDLQERITNVTDGYAKKYRKLTEENRNISHYTFHDLQEITDEFVRTTNDSLKPKIKWKMYIQKLFGGIRDFDNETEVYVTNIDFLNDMALILAETDDKLLETVIWWTAVLKFAAESKDLREIIYQNNRDNIQIKSFAWNCAMMATSYMTTAVARVASESSLYDKKATEKAEKMFNYIKTTFYKSLQKNDWLDEETRTDLLEKVENMRSNIGFPDWEEMKMELDYYYNDIYLKNNSYFNNKMRLIQKATVDQLSDIRRTGKDYLSFWFNVLMIQNAFYVAENNQIVVATGFLQFPYSDLGLESLNYGGIGVILGHELSHGFDNGSKIYDKDGEKKIFKNKETLQKYLNMSQCFVNQYSNYTFPESDIRLDGNKTLNENIADNGGLNVAYEAYQTWKSKHRKEPRLPGFTHLSHDQLFFLSMTHVWCWSYYPDNIKGIIKDSHSPHHVRSTISLQNSKYFSKAWNCPIGSNMNPKNKCKLW